MSSKHISTSSPIRSKVNFYKGKKALMLYLKIMIVNKRRILICIRENMSLIFSYKGKRDSIRNNSIKGALVNQLVHLFNKINKLH